MDIGAAGGGSNIASRECRLNLAPSGSGNWRSGAFGQVNFNYRGNGGKQTKDIRNDLNHALTVKSREVHRQFRLSMAKSKSYRSASWGHHMNRSVEAAARRHIVELESRVAQQGALIEKLLAANRDTSNATRTLRVLQHALSLTKEHLRFALRDELETCPPIGLTAEQQMA